MRLQPHREHEQDQDGEQEVHHLLRGQCSHPLKPPFRVNPHTAATTLHARPSPDRATNRPRTVPPTVPPTVPSSCRIPPTASCPVTRALSQTEPQALFFTRRQARSPIRAAVGASLTCSDP